MVLFEYEGNLPGVPGSKRSGKWADRVLEFSIGLGNEIDWEFVERSKSEGFPFYAESQDEYEAFTDQDMPLFEGYPLAVEQAIFNYRVGGLFNKNPMKCEYFLSRVRQRAEGEGGFCDQALLTRAMVTDDEQERADYTDRFKERIEGAAHAGDAQAQYAYGLLIAPPASLERFEWLLRAGEQGLSDAYHQLADHIEAMHIEAGLHPPLYSELVLYIRLAAEADNGLLAAAAQYDLAEAYENGTGDLAMDAEKALYWYGRSAAAGYALARARLESPAEHVAGLSRHGISMKMEQLTPERIRARFS